MRKSVCLMIYDDFETISRTLKADHFSLPSVEDLLMTYIYKSDSVILLVQGCLWPKDEGQTT